MIRATLMHGVDVVDGQVRFSFIGEEMEEDERNLGQMLPRFSRLRMILFSRDGITQSLPIGENDVVVYKWGTDPNWTVASFRDRPTPPGAMILAVYFADTSEVLDLMGVLDRENPISIIPDLANRIETALGARGILI